MDFTEYKEKALEITKEIINTLYEGKTTFSERDVVFIAGAIAKKIYDTCLAEKKDGLNN